MRAKDERRDGKLSWSRRDDRGPLHSSILQIVVCYSDSSPLSTRSHLSHLSYSGGVQKAGAIWIIAVWNDGKMRSRDRLRGRRAEGDQAEQVFQWEGVGDAA